MSLSQALSISLSGLRTTQAGLSLVAGNVANAQTPGYVRKSLSLETTFANGSGGGVRVAGVNRAIDEYIQRQLRVEMSGGSYASLRSDFYQRLQQIYGVPGSESSFETVFNNFTTAAQSLATSPESSATRSLLLSSAQVFAQYLNGMTNDIQSLRSDAENGMADAVATANNAMQKIATINAQLAHASSDDSASAVLKDQRDLYIDQLSNLMDIRVIVGDRNQFNVFTTSGIQLVGERAATLGFNPKGTVTAQSKWDANPAESGLGSLTLVSGNGDHIDLIENKSIRSGQIAAYIEMRDHILVEAQNQLDALAASIAQTLSNETVPGTATSVGFSSGFEVNTAGLLAGNTIQLTYRDNQTNQNRQVTIVRVDDPNVLPLENTATTDPNDIVVGIDFSQGMAAVVTQLNDRFGPNLQFDNPSGTTLRVLDDGPANRSDISGVTMTRTVTGLSSGGMALPFFTDATDPYTGFITSDGLQSVGIAGRIAVNPQLLGDPSKLVLFSGTTESGDPQRPNFILDRLMNSTFMFSPKTGLGTDQSPHMANLPTYMRQVLSMQGEAASNASSLAEGQSVVVNSLQQRVTESAGVNVDQEMAYLISLQTAYGASARVMSVVRDLIDTLMKM